MITLPDLHPDAKALTVFREHRGEPRTYTIAEAPGGRHSIERTLFVAAKVGYVAVPVPGQAGYAVLDILDGEDQPVQELSIPSRRAFVWWYHKLRLRMERDDHR
ncbi:hypothetical protein [Streptosporangium sp. CA-115845]|uniref:hypothetical protein n=1 Tax=Streptosporangium sp. CA-115845 TaxID=3240071 RepID=UPI003D8AF79C